MDISKEARDKLVLQGFSQALTGLGILLGAGWISSTTHGEILSLLQVDQRHPVMEDGEGETETGHDVLDPPSSEEITASSESNDLRNELANFSLVADGTSPESIRSSLPVSPRSGTGSSWIHTIEEQLSGKAGVVVCPWWSTPGYKCREHEKGACSWAHDDVPNGLKEPLICSFWASDNRCTKTTEECKFAHYPASHRQVAPLPGKKHKKAKKLVPESG